MGSTSSATEEALIRRFGEFTTQIEPGDTVVLFYAGHGVAFENGTYLIPGDVPALAPGDESLAKKRSIAERDLLQEIRGKGARVVVVVIDACRNNPFARK